MIKMSENQLGGLEQSILLDATNLGINVTFEPQYIDKPKSMFWVVFESIADMTLYKLVGKYYDEYSFYIRLKVKEQ